MINNPQKTLRFLQWNAFGIKNKVIELYDFMIKEQIDVSCIQETFLADGDIFHRHPNFHIYLLNRQIDINGRRSGGVAIIIRKQLKHNLLTIPRTKLIEVIGIQIHINNTMLNVYSAYSPGGATNASINQHFKNDVKIIQQHGGRKYIICGDLNAKHRLWNCCRANKAGQILYNMFTENQFLIHFSPTPTHFPPSSSMNPSTIDIAIHNTPYNFTEPTTHASDSDHEMITFDLPLMNELTIRETRLIPCFKETDWDKFRNEVQDNLEELTNNSINDIENESQINELIARFKNVILEAQSVAVPLVQPNRYNIELTPAIKSQIQERNRITRVIQRNPYLREQLSSYRNFLTSSIRHNIQQLRNRNFNKMLQKIPHDDQNRSLFRVTKFLKNRNNQLSPLKVDDQTLITSEEKANALADQFALNYQNPLENNNKSHTNLVNRTVNRFLDHCPHRPRYKPANTFEVRKILKKLKNNKAPGLDRIHNRLLKNLPPAGVFVLALIVNGCMKLGYFPNEWKHAEVIAIKKPNKPANQPSSYRPISLLSSVSKILERVVLTRLQKHLDDKHIIPEEQHGFRRGKSTTTQLKQVIDNVKTGLQNKMSTGMVLIDIEKAFDRVWTNGLVYKLIKVGTPHYIVKFIHKFVTDRSFHVKVNNKSSTSHQIKFGVPQGAVLSPTLYNTYTHDVPKLQGCQVSLFADDTAFYTTSRFQKRIQNVLQASVGKYKTFFKRWKITMNETKTQAIFYTNRRTKQVPTGPIRICNELIEWTRNVKYLGFILDQKLTTKSHIDYATNKCHQATRILYSMLNRKSKLDINSKLLLYKVAIRPTMLYAAPILTQAAQTNKLKLQRAQNKVLRMITNSRWRTSIQRLHERSNMELVNEFIDRLHENFMARLANQ